MTINGGGVPVLTTADFVAVGVRDAGVFVRIAKKEGPGFAPSEESFDSKPSFLVGIVWHALALGYSRDADEMFVRVASAPFIFSPYDT